VFRRDGTRSLLAAAHGGDVIVRAEPFDAIEPDLIALWGEEHPSGQPWGARQLQSRQDDEPAWSEPRTPASRARCHAAESPEAIRRSGLLRGPRSRARGNEGSSQGPGLESFPCGYWRTRLAGAFCSAPARSTHSRQIPVDSSHHW